MVSDIYAALAAVMADVDHVAKRDRNEHQRFLFRGIDAVVNAVGPVLRKHSVIVVPQVQTVHYDVVQTSTGKPASACRVVVDYSFYATDGSSVVTTVAAEAWDNGDKAAPKAMSVAFRTALLQALALPTDEADPDSQTYERAAEPKQQQSRPRQSSTGSGITPQQVAKIGALMGELGLKDRDLALKYVADVVGRTVESRNDLTKTEASKVIESLVKDADPTASEGFGG